MRWMTLAARWRRLSLVMAVILVAALAVFVGDRVLIGHGDKDRNVAGADRDNGRDGDEGDEDDGGPQAPADYLTLKWTSGGDVTPDQVARSVQQDAAMPQ